MQFNTSECFYKWKRTEGKFSFPEHYKRKKGENGLSLSNFLPCMQTQTGILILEVCPIKSFIWIFNKAMKAWRRGDLRKLESISTSVTADKKLGREVRSNK